MSAPNIYTGKDCTVTLNSSAIGMWTKYKLEVTLKDKEASPAASTVEKRVVIRKDATLTLSGYRGGSETFSALAAVGASATIAVTDEAPGWSDFTGWVISKASMDQGEDAGTYELELKPNYVGTLLTYGS